MPTGGVNLNTAAEFIEAGAAALGVGGELVQAEALKSGKSEVIVENARKFAAIVKQARAGAAAPKFALPAECRRYWFTPLARKPPSTTSRCPETKLAASEA